MTQFGHTLDKVLSGEKTATSRIVKPGDAAHSLTTGEIFAVSRHCQTGLDRLIYALGKDYAIQPGRGQKAVGRFLVTGIERYDVRTITHERARLEGFSGVFAFLDVWTSMHDPTFHARWAGELRYGGDKVVNMLDALANRQAAKYDAWWLTFELVSEAK